MQAKKKNDAELLKKAQSMGQTNDNRYMILTYTSEFSQYHYPLVMRPIQEHKPESLQNAIKRLSSHMEEQRAQTEHMSITSQTTRTNQFFKPDMAAYNPEKDKNEALKKRLAELKRKKEAFDFGGADAVKELDKEALEKYREF